VEPENPTFPASPQPAAPTVSPVFPKKNNLVVIVLAVLLLVSISIFLALQTQILSTFKFLDNGN